MCIKTNIPSSNPSFLQTTSVPPIIQQLPQTINYTLGDNVTLTCEALGKPTPTVQWFYNGSQLGEEGSGSLQLTIVNSSSDDEGVYTCVATSFAADVVNITLSK